MEIKRNKSIEDLLFETMRVELGKESREGIHLTDLMTPRKKFFQVTIPQYATDLEIMYWLTGRGHEGALIRTLGYEHAETKEWNGIYYSCDLDHGFPVEAKTRRGNLAEEGKEAETYNYYLKQLLGYCAVENKTLGWLCVWSLVEKQDDGTTKPEIACYEVHFTGQELELEMARLMVQKEHLETALKIKDHTLLPECPFWMCGKESKTMVVKPKCIDCDREFETEWGINKHINSKKGTGHVTQPAEYKTEYIKRCKWIADCKPFGNGFKYE